MVEANEVSEALWSLLTARVSSVFFALSRSRPYRHARPRTIAAFSITVARANGQRSPQTLRDAHAQPCGEAVSMATAYTVRAVPALQAYSVQTNAYIAEVKTHLHLGAL